MFLVTFLHLLVQLVLNLLLCEYMDYLNITRVNYLKPHENNKIIILSHH